MLPAASVNVFAATSMVAAPLAVGVNVAVYTVPEPEKVLPIEPLVTVTSDEIKFVVASLEVNVSASVASLVLEPSLTALLPSVAVIVMVGARPSAPGVLYDGPFVRVPWLPLPLISYAVVPVFSPKRQ